MNKEKMLSFLAFWGIESDDLTAIIKESKYDLTSTCLDMLARRIGQSLAYCVDAYEKYGTLEIHFAFVAIQIAEKAYNPKAVMANSAAFALNEAKRRFRENNGPAAINWALKSVEYSKGKYSEEWEQIKAKQ